MTYKSLQYSEYITLRKHSNLSFLGIGNAFSVLNDAEKRKKYDQFGEDLAPSHAERRYRHREFEGNILQDLFIYLSTMFLSWYSQNVCTSFKLLIGIII